MIVALMLGAVAHGQVLDQQLEDICDNFLPIAGTAGFTNGLQAVRTNAQTYGAGSFARRRMRRGTLAAMDFRGTLGVADVPVVCRDTDAGRRSNTTYAQPLDVGATNLGFNLPFLEDEGRFHVSLRAFYASSVTTSTLGARVFTTSLPLINLYPAFFAPVVGRSFNGRSLSTIAVDWIGGATFRSDVVSVQAGYTGTRGVYLDVTQEKVALFVNTAISQLGDGVTADDLSYLMGGVELFDPASLAPDPKKVARVGMTSVFYRQIPQTEAREPEPGAGDRDLVQQLRTGHLRQHDIGRAFDLHAAWQLGRQGRPRELAVAWHTDNWYVRDGLRHDEDPAGYVRVGMINLPDQPLFGVVGGPRLTVTAQYKVVRRNDWGIDMALHFNDPDLLDLYPFGYNALGLSVELTFNGDDP